MERLKQLRAQMPANLPSMDEIRAYLVQHACQSPVIDIVSPGDFSESGGAGR